LPTMECPEFPEGRLLRIHRNPFLKNLIVVVIALAAFGGSGFGQTKVRSDIAIPDIPGYVTLKCDFHNHTVFSDGYVWPTVRAEEAWHEGLDAFAITDHIEYHYFSADIPVQLNRSYDLAQTAAVGLNLIAIKGAEITRKMPPGHINAIFIRDVVPLNTADYRDAVKAAVDQGGFVFWNHPTFPHPEGKAIWSSEIEELYLHGWLKGVEVVNSTAYCPEAHQWCLDKKLTMLGNSDVHDPMAIEYGVFNRDHRPMTLVFAQEKSEAGIREALFARRTAVFWENQIIGEERYLKPIFDASVSVLNSKLIVPEKGVALLQIRNRSVVDFEMEAEGEVDGFSFPQKITLPGGKTVLLRLARKSGISPASSPVKIALPYRVKNLLVSPGMGLPIVLVVEIAD
jgi:3',5'-nucleoside bisphosphate phosphatase